jgi:hypothetical protein
MNLVIPEGRLEEYRQHRYLISRQNFFYFQMTRLSGMFLSPKAKTAFDEVLIDFIQAQLKKDPNFGADLISARSALNFEPDLIYLRRKYLESLISGY